MGVLVCALCYMTTQRGNACKNLTFADFSTKAAESSYASSGDMNSRIDFVSQYEHFKSQEELTTFTRSTGCSTTCSSGCTVTCTGCCSHKCSGRCSITLWNV